jgi:hypothetical protein
VTPNKGPRFECWRLTASVVQRHFTFHFTPTSCSWLNAVGLHPERLIGRGRMGAPAGNRGTVQLDAGRLGREFIHHPRRVPTGATGGNNHSCKPTRVVGANSRSEGPTRNTAGQEPSGSAKGHRPSESFRRSLLVSVEVAIAGSRPFIGVAETGWAARPIPLNPMLAAIINLRFFIFMSFSILSRRPIA